MAVITLAKLGESIKEIYAPRQTDLTRKKSNALTLIPENTTNISLDGLEARPRVKVRSGARTGFRPENTLYPEGEGPLYKQPLIRTAKHTTKWTFTPEAERRSKADLGSWDDLADRETKDVAENAAQEIGRTIFGGGEGVVAVTGTTTAANAVVLAAGTTSAVWRFLRPGLTIDIGTVANPTTVAAARTVTAVDESAGTITIDGAAVTTSSSHRIFVAGAGGSTAWGQVEMLSLQQLAGTGDLYDISTTTYPEFVGYQNTAGSNRNLTSSLMRQIKTEMRQRGGNEPTHFLTTPGVLEQAVSQVIGQVRYVMDDQNDLKHGVEALDLAGVKVVEDDFIWENTGFAVSFGEDGVEMASSGNYESANPESPIEVSASGTDARIVRTFKHMQLVATKRPSLGYVTKLAENW